MFICAARVTSTTVTTNQKSANIRIVRAQLLGWSVQMLNWRTAMAYPKNPNTIIIKNKFYPQGLKEIVAWNYYHGVKGALLKETANRNLMVAIMTDVNKPVLRRKFDGGKPIRMNQSNFDTVMTGRTAAVYSEMGSTESFGIIDIDIHPNDGFTWAKKVTGDVYDYVMDKMPIVRTAEIRFTGKTSFHIVCDFGRKMKIDAIRFLLRKFLKESPLARAYTVAGKRSAGIPNLDLSPNKIRGNYITKHSLSIWGLKCVDVSYLQLKSFDPRRAVI